MSWRRPGWPPGTTSPRPPRSCWPAPTARSAAPPDPRTGLAPGLVQRLGDGGRVTDPGGEGLLGQAVEGQVPHAGPAPARPPAAPVARLRPPGRRAPLDH